MDTNVNNTTPENAGENMVRDNAGRFVPGHSGNPRGKGKIVKPKITDDVTEDEWKQLVAKAKALALDGNEKMLIWMLEQKYGKAKQPIEGTDDGPPVALEISEVIAKKYGFINDTPSDTTNCSQ